MGRRTYASNEPNVLRVGDVGAVHLRELLSGQIEGYSVEGWRSATEEDNSPGYTGKLYPWEVTDGNGAFAFFVNAHQYADVGREDWVLFGPSANAVTSFARALGAENPETPSSTDIIQQTI